MELTLSGNAHKVTIRIAGALVADQCAAIREHVMELSISGRNHIELDMSETSLLDTAGMGILLLLKVVLKRRGGDLKVVALRPELLETLKAMRIAETLGITEPSP
jgi:anti-anti-sigma factor